MANLILFVIVFIIAFIIAYFLGRKRQMGFGWSFFFCIFLTPIIGLIAVLLSRKSNENSAITIGEKIAGWISMILGASLLFIRFKSMISQGLNGDAWSNLYTFLFYIGLIVAGIYLNKSDKYKNFNTKNE